MRTLLRVIAPIGLLTSLDISSSNSALLYLSVSMHTIIRGFVPAFVLLFAIVFRLQANRDDDTTAGG